MTTKILLLILNLILCLNLSPSAQAAEKPEQLWKEWYLYTVGGNAVGYFEEVAERRPADKQIAITQNWVENDGGKMETYIGSVASDDGQFTPVAFFSERTSANQVYKIDGRAKGKQMNITFKPEKPKGEARKKSLPLKGIAFLSNFLPMALAKRDPAKGGFKFTAIVEDAKDGVFENRHGSAELFPVKKTVRGETCRRSIVEFEGVEGEWWISEKGKLCGLSTPASKAKLELTTEAEAKKALGL